MTQKHFAHRRTSFANINKILLASTCASTLTLYGKNVVGRIDFRKGRESNFSVLIESRLIYTQQGKR